jgi:rod shape-determining protein MreC
MLNDDLHFKESALSFWKLFFFLSISIIFLFFDKDLSLSQKIRERSNHLIQPIYKIAELPNIFFNNINQHLNTRNKLIEENKALKKKIFIQSGIIQKIPPLKEENKRLKKLLDSQDVTISSRIQIAELINVNLSPFSNKIVINKGKDISLFEGQTVIDTFGILGQISEVNESFSIVTLITDPGHALLAVNARTNKRIVISGTGDNRFLKANYVSLNQDIRQGDILITSGLDNIFPEGYLIGEISKIGNDKDEDFLDVKVTPSSTLTSNKEVMLLW